MDLELDPCLELPCFNQNASSTNKILELFELFLSKGSIGIHCSPLSSCFTLFYSCNQMIHLPWFGWIPTSCYFVPMSWAWHEIADIFLPVFKYAGSAAPCIIPLYLIWFALSLQARPPVNILWLKCRKLFSSEGFITLTIRWLKILYHKLNAMI